MGRTLKEMLDELPKDRKQRIENEAKTLLKEYKSLQEFRKTIGWTQEELANKLEIKQANISKLESRGDMRLSTLRKYVEAMGYQLEISICAAPEHKIQQTPA